jgi:hypothetical protein
VTLPDVAGVDRHHRLAGLAPKSLAEFRHVLHHAVHAEFARGVRIGLDLQAKLLGPSISTPALPMPQEELLSRSVTTLLAGEVDVLTLGIGEEGNVGKP